MSRSDLDLPETVHLVVDLDHWEGMENYENFGEQIDGREVIVWGLAYENQSCETCGEEGPCYALHGDPVAGVPECYDCLASLRWVEQVIDVSN